MARTLLSCSFWILCSLGGFAQATQPISVSSPDGRIVLELSTSGGTLTYQVKVEGRPVLAPSSVGIESNDQELGEGVTLGTSQRHTVHEQYRFRGAHATATNDASEATVPASSHGESYLVDLHVADDGVAVRLRLPAKAGRKVQADRSSWALAGDPTMWVDKLDASYESPYHTSSLSQLGDEAFGFPLTAHLANGPYVTLTEADVDHYGDLAVRPGQDHILHGEFYADPQGWTTDEAVVQPWRVTVIARDLTQLVNTTLVQNLNPPPSRDLATATWIRPGRSSWQWLSSGDPVQSEQTQWVDWTSELGFNYYLIDEGWEHWQDPWGSLAKVVAYARSKNVKIWIWVHSREVKDPAAREEYFRKAVEAGAVGVKIDFPPPSNHEVASWYFATAADAASHQLMVDFHGATKPTGMERTWPNVLTREGVRGHEWHITRYHRVLEADHDVILPFTRYIAGPGDYTPTVFTPSELQGNTWAHELAQSVIFTSPFLCFGGSPASYLANPARDVLTAISSTWDETHVLSGSEPGKIVAEARRSGNQWFIAVINGGQAGDLTIPLDFLGPGAWKSTLLRDSASGKPSAFDREDGTVRSTTQVKLTLQPRGGFVAWLRPAPSSK
jgi:alpha-glucosidase